MSFLGLAFHVAKPTSWHTFTWLLTKKAVWYNLPWVCCEIISHGANRITPSSIQFLCCYYGSSTSRQCVQWCVVGLSTFVRVPSMCRWCVMLMCAMPTKMMWSGSSARRTNTLQYVGSTVTSVQWPSLGCEHVCIFINEYHFLWSCKEEFRSVQQVCCAITSTLLGIPNFCPNIVMTTIMQ